MTWISKMRGVDICLDILTNFYGVSTIVVRYIKKNETSRTRKPKLQRNTQIRRRVGKVITAQASHRTVREVLPSYGSCYSEFKFSL
jgi:Na+-transporting methylmalonyl-CoA/oxaloacetate decarboxylase gamma subunit